MSLYLNYKLTLNSGETFESTNGGYQGPIRDAFLAETSIAKLQQLTSIDQLKFYQKQIEDRCQIPSKMVLNGYSVKE